MKIKSLSLKKIFDSRGEPTIEVCLTDGNGRSFCAQIPSGKSRGSTEVAVFSPQKAASVLKNVVKKKITGKTFSSLKKLDAALVSLDKTENKRRIGGNLALGISTAFVKALAFQKKELVWEVLRDEFFSEESVDKKPLIFSNLINGGAHAKNNLSIQEYLVIAKPRGSYAETTNKLINLYKTLGEVLKRITGFKGLPLGDEGGYAVNFKNNFEPVRILEKLIYALKLNGEFNIGLDSAADNFSQKGKYLFEKKRLNAAALKEIYLSYFKRSSLLYSIEDPFSENDYWAFQEFKDGVPEKLIVADDLTATNTALIKKFGDDFISGVIIKPNQVGTVSETCEAIKTAKKHKLKIIISHRSGETEDNFIVHLAKACGADGVKIGAPIKERISKFNELIRIFD